MKNLCPNLDTQILEDVEIAAFYIQGLDDKRYRNLKFQNLLPANGKHVCRPKVGETSSLFIIVFLEISILNIQETDNLCKDFLCSLMKQLKERITFHMQFILGSWEKGNMEIEKLQ